MFSTIRAQRINWIKATLESANAELYQGWNKATKMYDNQRRVSVVYADFVVVILINQFDSNKKPYKAEFITAYVADNSIDKIKKSPRWEINNIG